MTLEELLTQYDLKVATENELVKCEPFSCDNEDLDEFFIKDATEYLKHLLGKTYIFCSKSNPKKIVCAFTLSNDSIRINKKIQRQI